MDRRYLVLEVKTRASIRRTQQCKHRPEVEAEVRGSILGKLNALKKETEESKKDRKDTIRRKGVDR